MDNLQNYYSLGLDRYEVGYPIHVRFGSASLHFESLRFFYTEQRDNFVRALHSL